MRHASHEERAAASSWAAGVAQSISQKLIRSVYPRRRGTTAQHWDIWLIMRRSLVLFCCVLSVAVACAGFNYPDVLSKAAPVPVKNRGLHNLSIPNLDLQHRPISEFRAISDRPLFTPSRRPTLAAETAQVQVYRLRGVLTANSQKIALVERVDDGSLLRVGEGDVVDVWRVSAISRDSISWSRLDRFNEMVVSEMWGQEEAPTSPDASQEKLLGGNDSNEQNASANFNNSSQHTPGEPGLPHRHLTDASDYAPFLMPTDPPPPSPTAPRHPPMRRIWKGPA